MKTKTDAEILATILKKTRYSAYSIFKEINKNFPEEPYGSPSTIYHILNGVNSMSYEFKARLLKSIPNLNPQYLDIGDGEMLKRDEINEVSLLDLATLPERLDAMESQLKNIESLLKKLLNSKQK